MKQTALKLIIAVLMLMPASTLVMAPAYAACGKSEAARKVAEGIDQTTNASCDDSGVTDAIALVVNILSLIVGAAAIIALIWAGFKYITSGGDTNKVANAKNTLIYAIVGIAIVGLAQILVHFVLSTAASIK